MTKYSDYIIYLDKSIDDYINFYHFTLYRFNSSDISVKKYDSIEMSKLIFKEDLDLILKLRKKLCLNNCNTFSTMLSIKCETLDKISRHIINANMDNYRDSEEFITYKAHLRDIKIEELLHEN